MKQNNSIFTRVLSLVLCMLMFAGVLTACFQMPEFNPVLGTLNGVPTPDTTTGNVVENEPNETPEDSEPVEPVDPNLIFSASTTVDANNLILGTLTNDVVIGGEGATALVPADVVLETGASSLALTLKNVEENDVDFGDAELLNNLDVHISGIAANNTVPMTVALGAILEAGLGATELKLYHIEDGEAVLMTRVASANDFAIHNQYTYNEETGEVTIYVASFSVFAMVKATADVWDGTSDYSWYNTTDTTFTLATAEQFAGFRDIVDGTAVINDATVQDSFAGKTVILGADIDLDKINFDPIGYGYTINKDSNTAFMGIFDGGNHTIYNLYEQGWDLESATGKDYTYSTAGAGLFGTIENATIKNLAVSGAEIVMECVDMGIVVGYAQGTCHFENIIVTNSTIGNYQRATGGVVGEVCYGPYGTDITNGYSHTFKDIIVDSSVTVGSLWGDFDNLNGGVIGGKWGDATVKMENVTVAVTLDAYSDVTSAYQWYAYRRSGMLIGHTEQNSPKKAETADAPFLTCENVKVYYGDWVNYTYCQFEHTNNPGYRYPWVRVEEGRNCGAYSNPRYGHPVDFAGNSVTSAEHTHAEGEGHNVLIKFDQLYGGGQGVYGKADHTGVTVVDKNTTTLYIKTNATNVKLFYWYDTTWTNVVDGIELVGQDGTFRADIPAYAQGFKLVVDGVESEDFVLANYADGETITLGQAPCTHETTTTTTVDATCTTDGSITVTCTCGHVVSTEVIPATGHVNTTTTTVDATCTVDGSITVTCACGHVVSTETISATGHDYEAVVTDPDCENEGYTTYTCTVCGNTYTDNHTDATGHTYESSVTKNPTCTETGVKTYTCSCGDSYTETIPTIDHSYNAVVTNPTCTEAGYTTYTCACGDTYTEAGEPATGHDYEIEVTGPTCTETGYTTHTCYCGDSYVTDEVSALGHKWSNNTCSTCGAKIIYFQNSKDWETLKLQIGETIEEITLDTPYDDVPNHKIYEIIVPGNIETFEIINSDDDTVIGTIQFADLVAGNLYTIDRNGKIQHCAYNNEYYTVYFYNNESWTNVSLYYWYVDPSDATGKTTWDTLAFPGEKMTASTKDGTYDIYKFVVPAYATSFIISNGTNAGVSGHKQTVDISVDGCDGKIYDVGNTTVSGGTTYNVGSSTYKSGYTTIYLKNNYKWDKVQVYYNIGASWVQANTVTLLGYDGSLEYYSVQIPNFAVKFNISGEKNDGNGSRQQIQDQKLSDYTSYNMVTPSSGDGSNVTVTKGTYSSSVIKSNYRQLYFKPSSEWYTDSARFAVYAFKDGSGNAWYSLSDKYSNGIYKVWVSTTYDKIILCRMKPNTTNDWANKWNQTNDLIIPTNGNNLFTHTGWNTTGTWSKYTP